jgi:pimeloyl-ACP methyl ester carboxylesterase
MPWKEIQGQDIYYVEAGSGAPFVFLHGMSSCGEAWWQQFESFSDRYHVYGFDSVNHGHSSNSPRDEHEPDRTDELEAFLDAMGIDNPILAGNSMGGATILRWAARHPGDAKALIISGMGVAEPGQSRFRELRPMDNETLFLPIGESLTDKLREERPRMYERYLRIRSTATRLEYMRNPRPRNPKTLTETAAIHETIAAVTSPMLVIVGSLDGLVPNAQRLHALVSQSEFVSIEGAPHNVYWEAAAEWNQKVGSFLDDL